MLLDSTSTKSGESDPMFPGGGRQKSYSRSRLLTPTMHQKVLLSREESERYDDAPHYTSVSEVLTSKPFLTRLITNTVLTLGFNILFSWAALSTWNQHDVRPIYLWRLTQPAGDKGAYVNMALDMATATFIVAFINTANTWDRTDDADLGKLGGLLPNHISGGVWRFVPKGPNCVRAFVSAIMFTVIFGGLAFVVMTLLWAANVGGPEMQVPGWSFIIPKSIWCAVEAGVVFSASYVVALTRCDRHQRHLTLRKLHDNAIGFTKFINAMQILCGVGVAVFTGVAYFFAFGGIQLGPLIGMWSCSGMMILLAIMGLCLNQSRVEAASQTHLFYYVLLLALLVATLVSSAFCLIYSEQGIFIIQDNWDKIKVGVLPFTSEYDLQQSVTTNMQFLAGIGFGSATVMLIVVLHFSKQLGPGQNLVLSVQALNAVLVLLGVAICWMVATSAEVSSYGCATGARDMIVLMVFGLLYTAVSLMVGAFVVSSSTGSSTLSVYAGLLFAMGVPTAVFSALCLMDAAGAETYVYDNWEHIAQLLPSHQTLWTACAPTDVTKCKEGLAITARANFQAVGWLGIAVVSTGCLVALLAVLMRQWHLRYTGAQLFSGDVENADPQQRLVTPRRKSARTDGTSTPLAADESTSSPGGYGTAGSGAAARQSGDYDILRGDSSSSWQQGDEDGMWLRLRRKNWSWSTVSHSGLGLSLAACLGKSTPSAMLRRWKRWSRSHPQIAFLTGLVSLTVVGAAIFMGAYLTSLQARCALVASNAHQNRDIVAIQTDTFAPPIVCMRNNFLTGQTTIGPLVNGSLCPPASSPFPKNPNSAQALPLLTAINIVNDFPFGSVNVVVVNSTVQPNITAMVSLIRAGHDPADMFEGPLIRYNDSTGVLDIELLPPEDAAKEIFGYPTACPSAALTIELPSPFYGSAFYGKQSYKSMFAVCATSQYNRDNNQPAFNPPIAGLDGCVDIRIKADSVLTTFTSEVPIALSDLAKNQTQNFFNGLTSQYPLGNLDITSKDGNIIVTAVFAARDMMLMTGGNVVLFNSLGRDVLVDVTSGAKQIQANDLAALDVGVLSPLLPAPNVPPPTALDEISGGISGLGAYLGNVTLQSGDGDVISTGIFACDFLHVATNGGSPVASTVEILGSLNVSTNHGVVYLTSVDSTGSVTVTTGDSDIHGSALIASRVFVRSDSGSFSAFELFLGSIAGLLGGLPTTGSAPDLRVEVELGSGDLTIEGLQGLKNPSDAEHLHISLQTGAAGNIKLVCNGNGFLGHYQLDTSDGNRGVLIQGNQPSGAWLRSGCVPLPSDVFHRDPPSTCTAPGAVHLQTHYGNIEFVVETGS